MKYPNIAKLIYTIILILFTNKFFAQIADGKYYIYNLDNYLALTSNFSNNNISKVTLEQPQENSNSKQIWIVKKLPNGYTICNQETNENIDVYDANKKDNAPINTYEKTNNNNQIFTFNKIGNAYNIIAKHSGKYLNTNNVKRKTGLGIQQNSANYLATQQWRFANANEAIIPYNSLQLITLPNIINNTTNTYSINAQPAAFAEAYRMARNAPADYIPAGLYANKNATITLQVSGLSNNAEDFLLYVGEPNGFYDFKKENNPTVYLLKNGANSFKIKNAGLVYFCYTNHPFQQNKNNTATINFTKGVTASPLFLHNKTNIENWEAQLKAATPFVQFLSDKAIITVSRKSYNLNKNMLPNKTFEVLHQVLNNCNVLAGFDNTTFLNTATPLRVHYKEDALSNSESFNDGVYMYAGDNFIGITPNSVPDLLNHNMLKKEWAIWHETGHLFQNEDFTWDEMIEVTVNTFSLYNQEAFGNKSRIYNIDNDDNISIAQQAKKYLDSDERDFKVGNKYDMNFICMVMYEQLRKAFGNQFYASMYKLYRLNRLTLEEAKNEEIVIQQFIFNSCKISGYNLIPFFNSWGLSISTENLLAINNLNLPNLKQNIWRMFVD